MIEYIPCLFIAHNRRYVSEYGGKYNCACKTNKTRTIPAWKVAG